MGKLNYTTTIAVDTQRSAIHYYSMLGNDQSKIEHRVKNYSGYALDENFFNRFKEIINEFVAETPSESIRKISLILPDNAIAVDTVNVPTMRKKAATDNALGLALGEIYRNSIDLKIQSHLAAQNKQYTTYSVAAIQKKILTGIYSVCAENKMLVETTTYAASSTIGAVTSLNPKLKNATYLFLDIKDTFSRFVFVVNGRTVGFYTIPFGLEFLDGQKYIQEDMLFDHTLAELTVLNAREKAKSKKLTVLAETSDEDADAEVTEEAPTAAEPTPEEDAEFTDEEAEQDVVNAPISYESSADSRPVTPKVLAKKTPRRLPKFMQRPIPETPEQIVNENFRVFVKWALSLLISNEKILTLGAPEFVCVNIPAHLSYAIDAVNEEKEENCIEFRALATNDATAEVLANLEFYGGFFPKAIHKSTKF